MSEEFTPEERLAALKQTADTLGIKYHPNIGEEALAAKVKEFREEKENDSKSVGEVSSNTNTKVANKETLKTAKNEALKLVRVRITCMNPMKKNWQGEMFTVGNSKIGSVKKFVPFETEWHVPSIMLKMIQSRKYQSFYNTTDERGRKIKRGKLIKEFAVEILPNLTEKEIKDLAQRQAMANGTPDT